MLSGMLAAHLDADPVRPDPARFQSRWNDASARGLRARYLANRRGTAFGVPRDAYETAVAAMQTMEMQAMERRASSAAIAALAAATPQWTALGPLPISNEIPLFGSDSIGGPLASATGRVTAIAVDPTTSGRLFSGTAGGGVWRGLDEQQRRRRLQPDF